MRPGRFPRKRTYETRISDYSSEGYKDLFEDVKKYLTPLNLKKKEGKLEVKSRRTNSKK